MNLILEEMNKIDADGVDFVPLWFDKRFPPPVIRSYTKEEYIVAKAYPRSNRLYWKMINGKKEYIND